MDSGIDTVARNSCPDLAQEKPQGSVAEQHPGSKKALELTMFGFGVVGAGSMWAWIIVEAVHWIFQAEAIMLQSPLIQELPW